MAKTTHEVRDPIHVFIKMSTEERRVVDSPPLQRLRHIHQLALTSLLYPGATHTRFEHSLGVMELATRVYDRVSRLDLAPDDSVRDILPRERFQVERWRLTLRMAALCHDVGHLPFSHAAEREVLPEGWDHDRLTIELILAPPIAPLLREMGLDPVKVAMVAVGPSDFHKHDPRAVYTTWELVLSEILVGDAFGVDRMDYLLRDSYYAGVAYGRFDHYRLVDTLRILPRSRGRDQDASKEPTLGVEEGGLHSAEALLLARYFMYRQVYFHHVRRIYDSHLTAFLRAWLPDGQYSTSVEGHLRMNDHLVMTAILQAAADPGLAGHGDARRIACHEHYRRFYECSREDLKSFIEPGLRVFREACREFGEENMRHEALDQASGGVDFPVLRDDEEVVSSLAASSTLAAVPVAGYDYVYCAPEIRDRVERWWERRRATILPRDSERRVSHGEMGESCGYGAPHRGSPSQR